MNSEIIIPKALIQGNKNQSSAVHPVNRQQQANKAKAGTHLRLGFG
jgi:hypothetical protein